MTVAEITPRRQRTRDRLVDAAIGVIAEVGVVGASIEAICEAAGMTRGAFYSNFATKDDLLLAIIDRQVGSALSDIQGTLADDLFDTARTEHPEPTQALAAAIHQVFDRKPLVPHIVLAERQIELYVRRVPELQQKFDELLATHMRELSVLVENALAAIGGRPTIPTPELLDILADLAKAAELKALTGVEGASASGSRLDPAGIVRVLTAFVTFG
ncbi:TetR/AcrR family transcriptional regulator [Brevibacterium litoralis]|uniref:TetR/AcrR family transcriptional regulator n=1 Tax=Brevibacterium litoralis TaxID=3138935 RepID=UPI0032EC8DA9